MPTCHSSIYEPPPLYAVADVCEQKLRRYTGLNHLAQAARSVLSNPGHVDQVECAVPVNADRWSQMRGDYSRIDFNSIQEQVENLCDGCDGQVVARCTTL